MKKLEKRIKKLEKRIEVLESQLGSVSIALADHKKKQYRDNQSVLREFGYYVRKDNYELDNDYNQRRFSKLFQKVDDIDKRKKSWKLW